MRTIEKVQKLINTVTQITCDRCGTVTPTDDVMECQEFMSVEYNAGYGNRVFQDGDCLHVDLCQYCVKEVLGPYLKLICNPISGFGYNND